MKPGRRIANPVAKQLAGTYRNDRHGDIVELVTPRRDEPIEPPYLSPAAKAVWREELRRVVGCGVTESDSSLFGRYCEMEASFRQSVMKGADLKAALLTELRRSAELLGIAGQRSRLARAGGDKAKPSAFQPIK